MTEEIYTGRDLRFMNVARALHLCEVRDVLHAIEIIHRNMYVMRGGFNVSGLVDLDRLEDDTLDLLRQEFWWKFKDSEKHISHGDKYIAILEAQIKARTEEKQ